MACCHNDHNKLKCYSPFAQIVVGFGFGILMSPWSYGYFFLLLGILISELFWFYRYGLDYFFHIERPLAVLSAFFAWAISRYAVKADIFCSGKEYMEDLMDQYYYNKK